MSKDFTIDKVSWHTEVAGNPESRERIMSRFFAIVSFLQDNGLTKRKLVTRIEDVNDDLAIHTRDLTDVGVKFMKAAYDKWVHQVDRGMDPEDTDVLARALAELASPQ